MFVGGFVCHGAGEILFGYSGGSCDILLVRTSESQRCGIEQLLRMVGPGKVGSINVSLADLVVTCFRALWYLLDDMMYYQSSSRGFPEL